MLHVFMHAWRYALLNQCALCGNLSQNVMCDPCDEAYWNESQLRCARCALPFASGTRDRHCDFCADCSPAYDATIVLADYAPPLERLAADLKFRAHLGLAREFARRLAHAADDVIDMPDLLVPVPLSAERLATRGYNQAWEIARPLGRRLEVRADAHTLVRARDTAPQASLDARDRHTNVHDAFDARRPVDGLHVGVVDDVMTSGATLDALAHALKAAGARRVTNFVALRTPRT